jgi:uncharacterized protein YndB with AHSA1/START domain
MRPSARRGGGVAQVLRPEAGELEVRIEARPETVFEFFVDPEKMSRWKAPRPNSTRDPVVPTAWAASPAVRPSSGSSSRSTLPVA